MSYDGEASGTATLTLGIRPPRDLYRGGLEELRKLVDSAEQVGLDRLTTGDHISFRNGEGFDGLAMATALIALTERVEVQTSVLLLALRHPVIAARQIADIALMGPGRFVLGVGLGGDDRHEMEICGVDPRSRGRRFDACLTAVGELMTGRAVSMDTEFFGFAEARLSPTPPPPPLLIGGRSDVALRRVAERADGWLGLFVSGRRFAEATAHIDTLAEASGRADRPWRHGMYTWCTFESTPDRLASSLHSLYGLPWSKFERYAPYGSPEQIADFLTPYVEAGCRNFDLAPVGISPAEDVLAAATVRSLLMERLG